MCVCSSECCDDDFAIAVDCAFDHRLARRMPTLVERFFFKKKQNFTCCYYCCPLLCRCVDERYRWWYSLDGCWIFAQFARQSIERSSTEFNNINLINHSNFISFYAQSSWALFDFVDHISIESECGAEEQHEHQQRRRDLQTFRSSAFEHDMSNELMRGKINNIKYEAVFITDKVDEESTFATNKTYVSIQTNQQNRIERNWNLQ